MYPDHSDGKVKIDEAPKIDPAVAPSSIVGMLRGQCGFSLDCSQAGRERQSSRSALALTPGDRNTYSHLQIGDRGKIGRNPANGQWLPT